MLGRVDEVWAYSRYVRDCYLDAAVLTECPNDREAQTRLGRAKE